MQVLLLCYAAASGAECPALMPVTPLLHMHCRLQKSVSHNDRRSRYVCPKVMFVAHIPIVWLGMVNLIDDIT